MPAGRWFRALANVKVLAWPFYYAVL